MTCRNPECGATLNPSAMYCGKCGVPVRQHCTECNSFIPIKKGVKCCWHCGAIISEMKDKPVVKMGEPVRPASSDSFKPPIRTSSVDSALAIRSDPIYSGDTRISSKEAPVNQLKTDRSLGMLILLSIVTFGLYSIYFYTKIGIDVNTIASRYDGKRTMHFCLLSFVLAPLTFGIATFVWFHRMSDRVGAELQRRGYEKIIGSDTYWLWGILGAIIIVGPFVYIYKLAGAMNALATDYNSRG